MRIVQVIGKSICKAYSLLISGGNILQHPILLVFRLYWGWKLYLTGSGKLANHDNVVKFFSGLGIPMPGLNAWMVGGIECFGGIMLMIGLLSRPVAFLVACTMFVAYISVTKDREALFSIFEDPGPFMEAAPFFYLVTALIILAFGPGLISLDALLKRKLRAFCAARLGT